MLRTTIGGSLPRPGGLAERGIVAPLINQGLRYDAHKDFAPVVNSKGGSA